MDLDGCFLQAESPMAKDTPIFTASGPGKRYTLDLGRPYHRAVLRMLYKTAERFSLEPNDAFSKITSSKPYQHAPKDKGLFQVPSSGKIALTFSVDKALEKAMLGKDDLNFGGLLERHYEMMRLQPGLKKASFLFGTWRSLEG